MEVHRLASGHHTVVTSYGTHRSESAYPATYKSRGIWAVEECLRFSSLVRERERAKADENRWH